MYNFLATTKRMTIASMVIAVYIVVLYVTQGISFGAYQIRIATALYALAYWYPFLVVPLGIANLIANFLFGGLGPLDMLGGCAVGMITTWLIVQIRQHHWSSVCGFRICCSCRTACSSSICQWASCRLRFAVYF